MTQPPDAPLAPHLAPNLAPRLARVLLDGEALTRLSPILEADRAQAVADLTVDSRFAPIATKPGDTSQGPYELRLSIWEGRLILDVRHLDGSQAMTLGLALGPLRKLIKDYQMLVDSHIKAVEEGREARIQAIDMGRRGLHDEAAALLCNRLDGKIDIDLPTARRLFTLVCVLHTRA
jgi:uncharacterized protein (UPF0262 family)